MRPSSKPDDKPRLSRRQINTLKHLAITCENGGMTTLTRNEREAMGPLWRRGIVEMWFRCIPDEGRSGTPFFRPSTSGWALIHTIFAVVPRTAERSVA